MRTEPLEDRRVLSAVTVTNNLDVVNGDTSSIANLIANDGGDGIALREAIEAANNTIGADEINFDFGYDGPETIFLQLGELEITDALTITGDGADLLTIDAQQNSRVMNITATDGDFNISRLTATGGSAERGGGLRNGAGARTVISATNLSGNTATLSATLYVNDAGGGIWNAGRLTIRDSLITNNSVLSFQASGGGIWNDGDLSIIATTISSNRSANGGGVQSTINGMVSITDSAIVDNEALNRGGGVSSFGELSVQGSTISGNVAFTDGGGGLLIGSTGATISHSTITDNSAGFSDITNIAKHGGGIAHYASVDAVQLDHTIVANNTAKGDGRDIFGSTVAANSLIRDNVGTDLPEAPVGSPDADGNLIGGPIYGVIDPLLGPLADNGGPTLTHALLPGSPAIDAGDPTFFAPPYLDQRGCYRVVDGDGDMTARIDMGAFEFGSVAAKLGDGNLDGVVDGLDYILWAMHFGDDPATDPPGAPLNGDFNDDGKVDGLDYVVWAENFELTTPVMLASTTSTASTSRANVASAVDVVIEHEYRAGMAPDGDQPMHDLRRAIAFGAAVDDLVGTHKNPRHGWR